MPTLNAFSGKERRTAHKKMSESRALSAGGSGDDKRTTAEVRDYSMFDAELSGAVLNMSLLGRILGWMKPYKAMFALSAALVLVWSTSRAPGPRSWPHRFNRLDCSKPQCRALNCRLHSLRRCSNSLGRGRSRPQANAHRFRHKRLARSTA